MNKARSMKQAKLVTKGGAPLPSGKSGWEQCQNAALRATAVSGNQSDFTMVDEGFSRMPTFSRVLRLFISCGKEAGCVCFLMSMLCLLIFAKSIFFSAPKTTGHNKKKVLNISLDQFFGDI